MALRGRLCQGECEAMSNRQNLTKSELCGHANTA